MESFKNKNLLKKVNKIAVQTGNKQLLKDVQKRMANKTVDK